MKLIAIDSSGNVASVALFDGEKVLGEYSVDHKKTHSVTLLPMLKELTERVDYALEETDAVVLSSGPGSFTGLRIGGAAGKGIAAALGCPILPVPTLEGLCFRLPEWQGRICPMLDARRSQVYSGIWRFEGEELICIEPGKALALEEMLDMLNRSEEEVIFLGDGCDRYREAIEAGMRTGYRIAPAHLRYQSAAALAVRAASLGNAAFVAADDFAPEYLRQSQAERERAERLAGSGS
ncbi:MAG: tRNA (adenosine(37)-N6)-threonylcarbamoyltransferase complex dimerization subunit type 1 TsaB [Lachnospiraceae bacterium]|nr:tRNA (adenosine(37)-N6)-threonylcarbamoyltransferase complex dimerization subunit type 1 TsaB [Lachnospiraceae bacterium]